MVAMSAAELAKLAVAVVGGGLVVAVAPVGVEVANWGAPPGVLE